MIDLNTLLGGEKDPSAGSSYTPTGYTSSPNNLWDQQQPAPGPLTQIAAPTNSRDRLLYNGLTEWDEGGGDNGGELVHKYGALLGGGDDQFGKYGSLDYSGFTPSVARQIWDPNASVGGGGDNGDLMSNGAYVDNPAFDQAAYDKEFAEYQKNPMFSVTRLRPHTGSDNDYETGQMKVETDPATGQQYLVPAGGFTNVTKHSNIETTLRDPSFQKFAGVVLGGIGGAALGLGGAGASEAGAALGGGAASSIAAEEAALASMYGAAGGEALGTAAATGAGVGASGLPSWALLSEAAAAGLPEYALLSEAAAAGLPEWALLPEAAAEGAGSAAASAGMTSAEKAALYGTEGYGPGMTGAKTGIYDSILEMTGSKSIADMAASIPGIDMLAKYGTKLADLDPDTWLKTIKALGALGSLGKKSGPGAFVGGANPYAHANDWTAAQRPSTQTFFNRPPQTFNWKPRPQGYAEGGGVLSQLGGPPPEMMAPEGPPDDAFVSQGGGSGQEDVVEAALAPGEYVFDADVVSALGDGSNEEGARRLDEMRQMIRQHNRSAPPDEIPPKALPPMGYLQQVMKG